MLRYTNSGGILDSLSGLFIWVGLLLTSVIGWVANIVALISIINGPVTGMVVLQAIGIVVAPLGIVLGWIHILT
jgi:hypothetical protein